MTWKIHVKETLFLFASIIIWIWFTKIQWIEWCSSTLKIQARKFNFFRQPNLFGLHTSSGTSWHAYIKEAKCVERTFLKHKKSGIEVLYYHVEKSSSATIAAPPNFLYLLKIHENMLVLWKTNSQCNWVTNDLKVHNDLHIVNRSTLLSKSYDIEIHWFRIASHKFLNHIHRILHIPYNLHQK